MVVTFTVPGMPKGKGRGIPVQRGNHLAVVSGPQTEAYQNKVAMAAAAAMCGAPPMQGGLELRLLIRLPIPKTAPRRVKEAIASGAQKPTRKPDGSNTLKAVEDGCNGVVWRDDSQVTSIRVRKVYADVPGLDVRIAPDDWAPSEAAQ